MWKYESVCDCWAILSYLEEGLEVEAPKTNPATVTLVSCTAERQDIHSSKHYITNNAAMHSHKVIMLRYFDVLVCCSWTILRIFWIRTSSQLTRRQRESTFRVWDVFTSRFWTISSTSFGCALQIDTAVRRRDLLSSPEILFILFWLEKSESFQLTVEDHYLK